MLGENSEKVGEVLAVTLDLDPRMQSRAARVLHCHKVLSAVVRLDVGPLLQLHDDIGVLGGSRVDTGEHHVDPLAGQWKLVFDQHLDLAQTGVSEILPQHPEAARPRAALCRAHVPTDLLHDPVFKNAAANQAQQTIGGRTER
ncbi:hypothetical protein ABZS52_04435 [Micromonospora profundi]|uniref:hypothetical protein n=1 Tax=Micromonospora profundi TaxID=1420889 RepID=UPI0033B83EA6